MTPVRAQHLVEVRQAVNALCDAVGVPPEYQVGDLQLASLQEKQVEDEDFTTLMAHVNAIRTNALVNRGAASFSPLPTVSGVASAVHVLSLRAALN